MSTMKMLFKLSLMSGLFFVIFSGVAQAQYQDYTYTYSDSDPDTLDSNYHYDSLAISSDGSVAAAIGGLEVSAEADMVIFKDNKKVPAWSYSVGDDQAMFDLALSSDGSTVIACGSGVWVYDIDQTTLLWEYSANQYAYDVCTLSADGHYLVAGDRGGAVTLWERSSSTPVRTWTLAEPGYFVNSVTMTKNGGHVLASTDFTTAYIDSQSFELRNSLFPPPPQLLNQTKPDPFLMDFFVCTH